MTTKVALYSRVSTLLGQDPELQLIQLRQVAAARGFTVVKEYTDQGISGVKESRPALNLLLKDAMQRKFDIIMVVALDRAGRNTRHILQLMDDLQSWNVSLISLRENLDFTTNTGKMVLTVISAVNALERAIISERIRNALAAKKFAAEKSGIVWACGRPSKVNPANTKEILALHQQGLSMRQIARRFGVSKTTVMRVVQNHLPRGKGKVEAEE